MRSQEIFDVFLEKAPATASSQRPRRCYGALMASYRVPTEFLWRFYARSRRVHCAFTALTLRALHCHSVRTVLSRHLQVALTAWHLKNYAIIRNCSNQNLNPALKTKTGNNYMCNIKNSQNTREHIVNRVSSYFLKRWPLSN